MRVRNQVGGVMIPHRVCVDAMSMVEKSIYKGYYLNAYVERSLVKLSQEYTFEFLLHKPSWFDAVKDIRAYLGKDERLPLPGKIIQLTKESWLDYIRETGMPMMYMGNLTHQEHRYKIPNTYRLEYYPDYKVMSSLLGSRGKSIIVEKLPEVKEQLRKKKRRIDKFANKFM